MKLWLCPTFCPGDWLIQTKIEMSLVSQSSFFEGNVGRTCKYLIDWPEGAKMKDEMQLDINSLLGVKVYLSISKNYTEMQTESINPLAGSSYIISYPYKGYLVYELIDRNE